MAATAQPPLFSCTTDHLGSRTVLSLRGELDLSTVDALETRIAEAFDAGRRSLVVDLAAVTFIDSSGLHCLLKVAARARRDGVELELVPGPAGVMRVFELTATDEILPFRRTLR